MQHQRTKEGFLRFLPSFTCFLGDTGTRKCWWEEKLLRRCVDLIDAADDRRKKSKNIFLKPKNRYLCRLANTDSKKKIVIFFFQAFFFSLAGQSVTRHTYSHPGDSHSHPQPESSSHPPNPCYPGSPPCSPSLHSHRDTPNARDLAASRDLNF